MHRQTFNRQERLKRRKVIARLFAEGQTFGQFPLRVFWLPVPGKQEVAAQFAVSVPKRSFRRAVDRNRIKRQIRETYRLLKPGLYERLPASAPPVALLVLYTAKEPLPYPEIEQAMKGVLQRLAKKLRSTNFSVEDPPPLS